jgi:hypothetical protein
MTILRNIWMTILLVALLPWGAYLRGMPLQAEIGPPMQISAAMMQSAIGSDATADAVEKPEVKCRKGVLGSTCSPEAKAFIATDQRGYPEVPHLARLDRKGLLTDGLRYRPALPPPRPV